jgi:hypothetical protein
VADLPNNIVGPAPTAAPTPAPVAPPAAGASGLPNNIVGALPNNIVAPVSTSAPPPAGPKTPPLYAGKSLVAGPLAESIGNPLANLLDYPFRAIPADIWATIKSPPTDPASAAKWHAIKNQIVSATGLPENQVGQALSSIASLPGTLGSSLVGAISRAFVGDKATEAAAPYAEMAADLLPAAGGARGFIRSREPIPPEMTPTPQARAAHAAGYSLAPEDISRESSWGSSFLSAISGKDKKYQALSAENQRNTNALGAQSIGLPAGTRLTEAAFDQARDNASTIYGEIDTAAPQIVTAADPQFRAAVANVGGRAEVLEEGFPASTKNPSIDALRNDLLNQPLQKPEAVRRKIAELRSDAGRNLRSTEAEAHQLGMAQRQAASALEDAVERSVQYGPAQVSAMAELHAAEQDVAQAQAVLRGEKGAAQPPGGMPAAMARLDQARRTLVQASIADPARTLAGTDLLNRYRAARQLFARTYDLELATNLATGDVSARRISALRTGALKRNLQGQMRQIADAYDTAPRSLQDPTRGARPEEYSILDLGAAGTSIFAGHPQVALGILSRPFFRRYLTSPAAQERMFNQRPAISTPYSGYAVGTALDPQAQADPLTAAMLSLQAPGAPP